MVVMKKRTNITTKTVRQEFLIKPPLSLRSCPQVKNSKLDRVMPPPYPSPSAYYVEAATKAETGRAG